MSVYAYTYVWETSKQKGTALLMLLALADYANRDTGECYPSIPSLAKMLRMSERNAQMLLKKLAKDKVITIQKYGGVATGTGNTNRYILRGYSAWREAVKAASPLEDEEVKNPVSSGEVLGNQEVKPASPKPALEPKRQPKDRKPAKSNTPEVVFRGEWAQYCNLGTALLTAFGLDFVPAENQTITALTPYLEVARELATAGAEVEEIPHLSKYIATRARNEEWSKYSVKTFSRYYTDFLKSRRNKIINDDPAMDLSKPVEIVPILMRKTEEAS